MYDLPKFNASVKKKKSVVFKKKAGFRLIALMVVVSSVCGLLSGSIISFYLCSQTDYFKKSEDLTIGEEIEEYISQSSYEKAVIETVKKNSPAVVSIIISKDVPIFEEYYIDPFEGFFGPEFFEDYSIPQYRQKGTETQKIGGGTGVIVSKDGMILTNKHVVMDEEADYTVFTNEGKKFETEVLAIDPLQDLAVIKIIQEESEGASEEFPVAKLGNSDELKMGQVVIAIGNALGEFQNTISVGIISALGRTVTASGEGIVETLEDTIQTDAAINKGNSGGPLLNLKGEVIGINTAVVLDAQSIGFAIPINRGKRDIKQIREIGRIVYPFLGVRYVIVNETVKEENNLSVDYGALITKNDEQFAIYPGSAAEEAGLKEGDVILEFNGEKINQDNSLAKVIIKYSPGDEVTMRILRGEEEVTVEAVLKEREEF